jgi:hypothetical protein
VWLRPSLLLSRDALSTRCLLAMTTLFACSHKEMDNNTNRQGWSGWAVVRTYPSTFGPQNYAVIFPSGTGLRDRHRLHRHGLDFPRNADTQEPDNP